MAKPNSILFVASEVFPFVKVSPIADVCSSLPLAMKEKGLDVRIMMPKYGHVSERKNRIHDINRLRDMPVPINDTDIFATIKSSSISNSRSKVQTYITTNDEYFNSHKGVYKDLKTGEIFPNNAERFIFFARSVVETCVLLEWYPEIIHCNDWHTALVPAMARILYPKKFKNTKFVFTVHNFSDQGQFPWSNFKKIGIDDKDAEKNFKSGTKLNFLKAGLIYSDHITTVSETYYNDVLENGKLSGSLHSILLDRKSEFSSILNYMDHWVWKKEKDEFLDFKIEDDDFENFKYNNKVAVVNSSNFEYHPKTPLFVINEDLDDNAYKTFLSIADKIFEKDVQFIAYPYGNSEIVDELKALQEKYPNKFRLELAQNEYFYHTLIAGSDFLLSNSSYKKDFLNIMYAATYGTVPIVNPKGATEEIFGGKWEGEWDGEDGFALKIEDDSKNGILKIINKALEIFEDKINFETLQKNGTYEEFGWDDNALKYEDIYKNLLK